MEISQEIIESIRSEKEIFEFKLREKVRQLEEVINEAKIQIFKDAAQKVYSIFNEYLNDLIADIITYEIKDELAEFKNQLLLDINCFEYIGIMVESITLERIDASAMSEDRKSLLSDVKVNFRIA